MGAYGTPEHLPNDNEKQQYQYGYQQANKRHNNSNTRQRILLVIYSCIAAVLGLAMLVSVSVWQSNKTFGVIFFVIYTFSSIVFYKRVKLCKKAWPLIICSAISLFIFICCVPINTPVQANNIQAVPSANSSSNTSAGTIAQYKKQCSAYKYKEIARNPNNYKGKLSKFTGQVMQIQDTGDSDVILLNVTKDAYNTWSNSIYVEYTPKSDNESRILEDDIITIYGELSGIKNYTAVLGNEISVPYLKAQYVEIQSADSISSSGKETSKFKITKAQYDKVKNGMSYKDVVKIFGFDGKQTYEYGQKGSEDYAEAFDWNNEDGSVLISLTFINNKLDTKTEYGLE